MKMITPEKAIEAIQKKITALDPIQTSEDFNVWQSSTVSTLTNIYSENDKRIKQFEDIEAYVFVVIDGYERVQEAKKEAVAILTSLIEDLQDFGIPRSNSSRKSNGVNVNINQHNHQNQTTNVNINLELFIDAIKDELKGGQVKELKGILDGNEEPEQKKKSLIDKIKSFRSDVASNILANVLTNPQVYEKIGEMF